MNKTIWLAVDQQTREKIAKDFGMVKTEGCRVVGNRVVSDGYSNEMLLRITHEELEKRVSRTQKTIPNTYEKLWEYYVADMKGEEIQYSNDDGLNNTFVEALNKPMTAESLEEPKFKITRTQKEAKEIVETIKKASKPKKIGRPKGSKNKK